MGSSRFLLIVLALIILLSSMACAIGLSGALGVKRQFVPDSVFDFSYTIVTSAVSANNYAVFAEGDLANYTVFDKARYEDVPGKTSMPLTGRVNFPSYLEPPGWHLLKICVIEDCGAPGNLCGRASVCDHVNFMVLHHGIFPIVSLTASNANRDQPVSFVVAVNNLGDRDITSCSGYVEVYDLENAVAGRAELESKPVPSSETASLSATFQTTGLLPGNYSATAFVDCDGNKSSPDAGFRIGTLVVKIVDYSRELETGGIKRMLVTVESEWNDPLDIYVDLTISDGNNTVKAKTATISLAPWKRAELEAFVDTTGLEDKEYDVKINAYYAEKTSSLDGKIKLVTPPPLVSPIGETASNVSSSTTMLTILLVIIVLILTIVNVFITAYRKKDKEK